MAKGKNVLTTGDVAKICNVAPRTVSKWFDSGQLKGYRIPGSRDRRIPMNELIRFMQQHGMPTDGLGVSNTRVLVVDKDRDKSSDFAELLQEKADYEVEVVYTTFETGLIAQKFAPHVMLLSLDNGDIEADEILKKIRLDENLQTIKIIAMERNLNEIEQKAILQKGYDGYADKDWPIEKIIQKIEQTIAIIY